MISCPCMVENISRSSVFLFCRNWSLPVITSHICCDIEKYKESPWWVNFFMIIVLSIIKLQENVYFVQLFYRVLINDVKGFYLECFLF